MPYPIYPKDGFMTSPPADEAESLFAMNGNMSGIGDDMLRFVAIRPYAVGGNTQMGGAWTIEPKLHEVPGLPSMPYGVGPAPGQEPPPGQELFLGREALIQAVRYGWSVSADHTVGDRAVEEVLKAYEEGIRTRLMKTTSQILTINHTPMARPEQIAKMKELGIRPSIGAWHIFWEPALDSALHQYGIERVNQMVPMKSHIKMGLKPALEGDLFIDPPFWRMQIAITRKDHKWGRVWGPVEKVTRQEALWMSTSWGAHNLGEENKLGTIEAGKLADLVVIDKDYMSIPEEEISGINVLMTIVDGKVVYEAGGEPR